MIEERLAKEIFEVRVPGKNRVGRPQRRWIQQVRQTAEQRDINCREAGTLTQNEREILDIIGIHYKWLLNKNYSDTDVM